MGRRQDSGGPFPLEEPCGLTCPVASCSVVPLPGNSCCSHRSSIRAQFANTSFAAAVGSVGRDLLAGRMMWKTPLSIMNGVYASTYLTANYTKVTRRRQTTIAHQPYSSAEWPRLPPHPTCIRL